MASSSDISERQFCYSSCPSNPYNCPLTCFPITPQFYFPPPPPPQSNQHISRIVIVVSVLAGIFLLVSLCSFIIKHSSRTSTSAINSHEDHDQTDNPHANRMRYVGHMGLEESVINSITVCKYRRAEGTVEGTDCSICLNEFREDEDLRLLPNCRHAFHLPCIDMWLKSHENCPLCRTDVLVSSQMKSSVGVQNSHPESEERPQVLNSRSSTGFGRNGNDGVIANHSSIHVGASELRDLPSSRMNNGFGSNSDSIESNRPREFTIEMMDDGIKRVGRSFSMDSLANLLPIDSEGSSTSIGDGKFIVPKPVRNQTKYKKMDNCSEGPSSQERPALVLKRSFSGGSKFTLARYGRSRESILPM